MTAAACVPNHNSGQFLEIVWLPGRPVSAQYHRSQPAAEGWYVRRTCPRHEGQIVIKRAYASQDEAREGVALLITASMVCGT